MHWCSWKDYLLICFRLLFAIRTQVNVHLSLNLTVIRILIIRQLLANICQEYNGTLLPKGLCSDLFLMVAYVDYVVTLSVSSLITDYALMYRCWSNCNRRFWCWTHHHYSYYNSHDRYSISYCHNRLCSVSMVNTVFFFFFTSVQKKIIGRRKQPGNCSIWLTVSTVNLLCQFFLRRDGPHGSSCQLKSCQLLHSCRLETDFKDDMQWFFGC